MRIEYRYSAGNPGVFRKIRLRTGQARAGSAPFINFHLVTPHNDVSECCAISDRIEDFPEATVAGAIISTYVEPEEEGKLAGAAFAPVLQKRRGPFIPLAYAKYSTDGILIWLFRRG